MGIHLYITILKKPLGIQGVICIGVRGAGESNPRARGVIVPLINLKKC